MIPDVYYQDYYLLIVALATLVIGLRYAHYSTLELQQTRASSVKITISFTVLIILFIGLRPQSEMFPDMMGYITSVENEWWSLEEIRWDTNYLFVPLMFFLQTMKASGEVIMLVLASIYFGALLIAMNKLFPKHRLLAMIVYCGAFMTFSNATNGMKAGCATAFFICAIAYFESKPLFALFLFLSLGFHHAAQLLVVVYMLCYVYNNYRFYLVIWLICLILAILHITPFLKAGSWTSTAIPPPIRRRSMMVRSCSRSAVIKVTDWRSWWKCFPAYWQMRECFPGFIHGTPSPDRMPIPDISS